MPDDGEKFKIKVENTSKRFRIFVYTNVKVAKLVYECGWHGGEFEHSGAWHIVMGPYHSIDGDHFRVYELVPRSEAV